MLVAKLIHTSSYIAISNAIGYEVYHIMKQIIQADYVLCIVLKPYNIVKLMLDFEDVFEIN